MGVSGSVSPPQVPSLRLEGGVVPPEISSWNSYQKSSPPAAELKLPAPFKIHPVVHVSNLKPSQQSDRFGPRVEPPPEAVLVEGELEDEVEDILDKRVRHKGKLVEYLVQWKGLPLWEASWEPKSNLTQCQETLQAFEQRACAGALLGDYLGYSIIAEELVRFLGS